MDKDRDFVIALARGVQLLGAFSSRSTTLTLTQLAERTSLPKATVARLAHTLTELRLLRWDTLRRSYTLGAAVLALGYPLLGGMSIRHIAQPFMRELSDYAKGNVSLGLLDRNRVVYIETCRPARPFDYIPDIGMIWPLMGSAIGRALISGLEAKERDEALNSLRAESPLQWAQHIDGVRASIDDHRRQGFCTSFGALRPGMAGVGVPVNRRVDGWHLAFNCAVETAAWSEEQVMHDLGPRLVSMVASIEMALETLEQVKDSQSMAIPTLPARKRDARRQG